MWFSKNMAPRMRYSQLPYYGKDAAEESGPSTSLLEKDGNDKGHHKPRGGRAVGSITFSQAFILAAASASLAAVLTAIGAAFTMSNRFDAVTGSLVSVSHTLRSTNIRHSASLDAPWMSPNAGLLKYWGGESGDSSSSSMASSSLFEDRILQPQHKPSYDDEDLFSEGDPKVVWLMSFPNSGTSFTIHLTRESSNTTTATNYALEGDIKDQPSVPALASSPEGPFLELIPNRHTNIPEYILTKTHCGGFCTDCDPLRYLETPRSFQVSCQTGRRANPSSGGGGSHSLKLATVTYKPGLVKKAIHVIRHPLDNAVARFHLTYKQFSRRGDKKWTDRHPYDSVGFNKWCQEQNDDFDLAEYRWIDKALADTFKDVPCYPEFFRYVQWHNMAFTVSRDMGLPTLVIHYSDYRDDLQGTIKRLLAFLELPRSNGVYEFSTGKEYRDYYTPEARAAVGRLVKEFATADTWHYMKDYDFS